MSGNGKMIFGAVVGGLVGATAALLLTPKTGREMRKEILQNLEGAGDSLRERSGEVSRFAGNIKEAAAEKWIEIRETASESLKDGEPSGDASEKSGKDWVEIGEKKENIQN